MNKTVIECNGIAAGYVKGLNILQGVDLIVHQKEIVSIIGPNGAGKSTLLKAIMGIINNPSVLLLDEPLAGVNPKLAEEILQIILNLARKGISILMVEHNIEAVMKISERVIVLAEGKVIADSTPENIRTDEKVIEAYLGSENE